MWWINTTQPKQKQKSSASFAWFNAPAMKSQRCMHFTVSCFFLRFRIYLEYTCSYQANRRVVIGYNSLLKNVRLYELVRSQNPAKFCSEYIRLERLLNRIWYRNAKLPAWNASRWRLRRSIRLNISVSVHTNGTLLILLLNTRLLCISTVWHWRATFSLSQCGFFVSGKRPPAHMLSCVTVCVFRYNIIFASCM